MGLYDEELKREPGPFPIALTIGALVFLGVWFLKSLSTAFVVGAAKALFTWVIWNNFQGKKLISLAVGVAVAWIVSKLFFGKFIAVVVGGAVSWGMWKWLQRLEEEERRRQELWSNVLGAGAAVLGAGAAALAVRGISKSFDGDSSGDKEKMMKVPGRGYSMRRKDFEDNPAAYFRDLHRKIWRLPK